MYISQAAVLTIIVFIMLEKCVFLVEGTATRERLWRYDILYQYKCMLKE